MQSGEEDAVFDLLEHGFGEPAAFFRERELAVPNPGKGGHWVGINDEKIVSHVAYYPVEVRCGGQILKTGIIANVCTHDDHRSRGIAAQLIECAIKEMQEKGLALSCLVGRSDYYQRFGYANIAPETRYYFDGDAGPISSVRSAGASDISWMVDLYNRCSSLRDGSMVRSPAYWEASTAISYVETLARDARDGYAVLSYYRPPGWALEEIQLLELEADSSEAAIELFRCALKRASSHGAQLLWSTGAHPQRNLLLKDSDEFLQDSQTTPGFMWRSLKAGQPQPPGLYLSHADIR